jgi:hypothetical protein
MQPKAYTTRNANTGKNEKMAENSQEIQPPKIIAAERVEAEGKIGWRWIYPPPYKIPCQACWFLLLCCWCTL